MGQTTRRKVTVNLELRSDVAEYPADVPISLDVPETATVREAALNAIRSSNLPDKTKSFIENVLLGRASREDVVAQPKVITQGGAEAGVTLDRQVGEIVRSTGSNRIVLYVAPVVG